MPICKEESVRCDQYAAEMKAYMEKKFWKDFNVNSTPQMRRALFGSKAEKGLGLEPIFYTPESDKHPEGQPSTGKATIRAYEVSHPIVAQLAEYRQVLKARGTYFDNYVRTARTELVKTGDNRYKRVHVIHPTIWQREAITGRESIRNPALQTIPRPPDVGEPEKYLRVARKPFGPRPGCVWWCMDYDKCQPRIYAELANERNMLKILAAGGDLYVNMGEEVNRVADGVLGQDPKKRRQRSKTLFLGKIFGEGATLLSIQLDVDYDIALEIIDGFDATFPDGLAFVQSTMQEVIENGYVETPYGQKLIVDEEQSYAGVNYKVQGSEAKMFKNAKVRVHNFLKREKIPGKIVLPVHDELVLEFRKGADTPDVIQHCMWLMQGNRDGVWKKVLMDVEASRVTKSWLYKEKTDLKARKIA